MINARPSPKSSSSSAEFHSSKSAPTARSWRRGALIVLVLLLRVDWPHQQRAMPPGVKIGPVKGSNLASGARNRGSAEEADRKLGKELQDKYRVFVTAAEGLNFGDYVKLRNDDWELLQRELDAFCNLDQSYASQWDDTMKDMVKKGFRIINACGDTGQVIIPSLPGAQGCRALRESTYSKRFCYYDDNGSVWMLPATALQRISMEGRCPKDHVLHEVRLEWHEGYVHTRTCTVCSQSILRSDARHNCKSCDYNVCSTCFRSKAKESLAGNLLTKRF
ncbi:unnamed protein product [Polarella glacialis]|uniref:Uncharacterized protein n=2 Tax=Polarella glacialis TaxID=89957 RepID=A0A813HWF9_POLGL|nr:unnamed protein product [Polarella glacialis]